MKVKKSPDKEVLDRLDDQALAEVGCIRKEKETFAYEIKWEEI